MDGDALALTTTPASVIGFGSEEQAGMKAFCETYKTSLDAASDQPKTPPDFRSQSPPSMKEYERALELAATSGTSGSGEPIPISPSSWTRSHVIPATSTETLRRCLHCCLSRSSRRLRRRRLRRGLGEPECRSR